MSYDFNSADRQQAFDVIPTGTIVSLVMNIRPGGAGEGGWMKKSGNSDALMLDCEFIVAEGPYARRKLWQYMVLSGGKVNDKGDSIAGNITRSTLRAMLESARGIMPDDNSDQAMQARRINGWQDFCGLVFLAKLGVEKDKTGQYADKNRIMAVITPDMKDYASGGNSGSAAPAQAAAPAPAWAGNAAPSAAPRGAAPAWGGQQASASAPAASVQPSETGFTQPPPQAAPPAASDSPVPAWAR